MRTLVIPAVTLALSSYWVQSYISAVADENRPGLTLEPAAFLPHDEGTPRVIDVAANAEFSSLAAAIRLAPGQRFAKIGDRAVSSELEAGAVLGQLMANRRFGSQYAELEIAGSDGTSWRVVILFH